MTTRRLKAPAWELFLLAAIAIDACINAALSPYFLDPQTLSDATFYFTEKGIVALPLALLIVAGEIDISVGGTIALASVAMGLAAEHGAGTPMLALIGILVGAAAGAFNGLLVTQIGLPSIVATIGTMSLFRGAASGILGERAITAYPRGFTWFGQGYVAPLISFELIVFALVGLACAFLLRATIHGRRIYAIGANPNAAHWSGIGVKAYRFWLYVAVGATAGLSSILLTGRLGSTRPSIAQGWELDIVAMVLLGGVAIAGGSGRIGGVALAAIFVGLATFGLSLVNAPGVVMSMIMGVMLVVIVAGPRLVQMLRRGR